MVSQKEERSIMNKVIAQACITQLLHEIEGPILRHDLTNTPERAVKALEEMLDGYQVDVDSLFRTFDGEGQDQIVIAKDIPFYSFCEHHLLLFSGKGHIAYLPREKVLGASKLPRILTAYAHRLQLQERITRQVADAIMNHLQPYGVAVILEAKHACIVCRGVKSDCSFVTSVMLGTFRENETTRLEVLSLLGLR